MSPDPYNDIRNSLFSAAVYFLQNAGDITEAHKVVDEAREHVNAEAARKAFGTDGTTRSH